ncbi:MAG: hypothetical protein Q9191_000241 [Dirinaria sp. TL-2023a]
MSTTMSTTRVRPRTLVIRNQAQNLATASSQAESAEETALPLAASGDVQLINYYKPALEGGVYTININQQVQVPQGPFPASTNNISSPPDNPGTQRFNVVAPRFALDPNAVHSTYPPQGHADQPMILPHIVFNDPHTPWERAVAVANNDFDDDDVVPWLAALPFDINGPDTAQELRLTSDQLAGSGAVYTPSDGSAVVQSTTATITMPLSQYLQLDSPSSKSATPVHIPPFRTNGDWADMQNDNTPVQVIFMNGSLFCRLFQSRTDAAKLDVSQFRYCAHVRNINTQGMADSGVEDTGLFSVLHSLRTGPTDIAQNTAPRTQAVHILNLEYIENMTMPPANDLVALVSLYSWTYLCQPPLSVNFVDAMRAIGEQIETQSSLLRHSDSVLAQLSSNALHNITDAAEQSTLQSVLKERFFDGYSLVRYRTGPGQPTVAFTRSPLAPVIVARPTALPSFSNNGQDFQILDSRVGIMDVSYSSAFQFGKTLASADMAFVAALMRIRGRAHTAGAAAADRAVADPQVTATSKVQALNALPATAKTLVQLSKPFEGQSEPPSLKDRWIDAGKKVAKTRRDIKDPGWKSAYVEGVQSSMAHLASAAPLKEQARPASTARVMMAATVPAAAVPFNDLSSPVSTDWAFLFNWIMDKLYLDGIPLHYLITDPAHLPAESIRFFHIDPTWLDCMIDGALSVANHLSRDDDAIRQSIKVEINRYLSTPLGSGHLPQVPLYGFFLRSAVVKVFPDLQLTIHEPEGPKSGLAPILMQKRVAGDVLMVLLDRLPDSGKISSIRFTQPVHQQCFSAGDSLDASAIEFMFRKVYRTAASQAAANDALHEVGEPHKFARINNTSLAYDWTSRCLNFAEIEKELFGSSDGLVKEMPAEWGPPVKPLLTSSMTAIQLNDTVKYLEVLPSTITVTTPAGITLPRQLYVDTISSVAPPVEAGTHLAIADQSARPPQVVSGPTSSVPVVKQQLPKPLPTSSATIQAQSLAKTPQALNTLTSAAALQRKTMPIDTSATSTELASKSPAVLTTSAASNSPATAAPSSSASGIPALNLGMATPGGAISSNPFPNLPPLPQVSQFQYAIYPSTFVYTKTFPNLAPPRYVDTKNPFPPDIVFSIVLNSPTIIVNQTLRLHEIDFRIPIGDPALRKSIQNDILGGLGLVPVNSSPGSSARMLSNQRWVVHMDVQPAYLNLRVIPRTLNLSIPVVQNTQLSFKLNEVEIAGPMGKDITVGTPLLPPLVFITVTEVYGFYADGAKTKWVNQGSAVQQINLQRK